MINLVILNLKFFLFRISENLRLEHSTQPATEDIEFLTQRINDDARLLGVERKAFQFSFFIRDNTNRIIAGVNGSVFFGNISTDQLWVDSSYRKQGYGKLLMEKVHEFGRTHNSSFALVGTMSFQNTKQFYEKLGYQCDYEKGGFVNNSTWMLLKKDLSR